MAQYKGIDVSAWQGSPNWEKVKAADIEFAILRAGYGKGNVDKSFKYNAEQCNKLGLPIGVYWFSYAYTEAMARAEADYCIDIVKAYRIEYPVYFDFEYDSVAYAKKNGVTPTAALVKKLVTAFCKEVEARGYYAGNYSNVDYLNSYGMGDLTSKYDLWLAQWSSSHSRSCGLWQYSASGSVPGISGNVDMDVSYLDYPSIIKAAGLNGFTKTETKQTETEQSSAEQTSTEQTGTSADDVIKVMQSWIGKSRSAGTHKDIIDLYNSISPLPVGYKVTYSDAYCDAGLSAAFAKCGAIDLVYGGECGVERHVKLFQAAGIWEEDGSVTPQRGWLIVYNWDDSTQPNDGAADHIGIVESVSGNQITCIECNINGGTVGRRTIAVGHGNIRGYAKPKYGKTSSATSATAETSTKPAETYPYGKASSTSGVIKRGSKGTQVQAIQYALNQLGYGNSGTKNIYGKPDGDFGVKTESAVIAFQRAAFPDSRPEWDGRVGPKTRTQFKSRGY